jgi:hypothetical protein
VIAVIRVSVERGEIVDANHLRNLAEDVFRHVPPAQRGQGATRYIGEMADAVAYSCIPRPGSEAYFLWLEPREFEVVIETFHQGDLLRSSESVVHALKRRLKQVDMAGEFEVRLQAVGDDRVYISGKPNSLIWCLWDGLKDHFVFVGIGAILLIVAKVWLNDYLQEAIATLITLVLVMFWQGFRIWLESRNRSINWRIYE